MGRVVPKRGSVKRPPVNTVTLPPGARIASYAFLVWEDAHGDRGDVYLFERFQEDGTVLWGIYNSPGQTSCWTRARDGFAAEPIPSSRSDEWLAEARFTLDEALAEALRAVAHMRKRYDRWLAGSVR
jgi:hypothetical protein